MVAVGDIRNYTLNFGRSIRRAWGARLVLELDGE